METITGPRRGNRSGNRRTAAAPAVAGFGYAVAWVAGLVIGPATQSVTAPDAEVVSASAGHQASAIAQVVLTEGVAAACLAAVVLALGQAARGRGARRLAAGAEVAGSRRRGCH